jgi:AraC family ethanolamine operon transcriptional activator
VDTGELKAVNARRRVVDRACSLIGAQHDEPVSLLQLCSRIGVSESKLNYCFQDVLGISPGRYLKAARLNKVRRELKGCRDRRIGVQDIAAHWGFWHLGQFSCDYKRQFGELPSETLRVARG